VVTVEQLTALDRELRAAQQADQSIAGLRRRLSALETVSAQLTDGSSGSLDLSSVEAKVGEIKQTLSRTAALGKDVSSRRSQVETLEDVLSTVPTHAERLPNQEAGEIRADSDERIEELPDDVLRSRLSAVVSLLRAEQERPDSSTEQYTEKVDVSRAIREEALQVLSACVDTAPEVVREAGAVPPLIAALNDGPDAPGRTHTAYTLRLLYDDAPGAIDAPVVPTMTRALADGGADTRYHAVYTLQTAAKRGELTEDAVAAVQSLLLADEETTAIASVNTLDTIAAESPASLTDRTVGQLHRLVRVERTATVRESAFGVVGTVLRSGPERLSAQAEAVLRAELGSASTAVRRLATLELLRTPADLLADATTNRLGREHVELVFRRQENPADDPRLHEAEFEASLASNEAFVDSTLVPVLLETLKAGDPEQVPRAVTWLLFVIQSVSMSEAALRGVDLGVSHDDETARKASLRALADAFEDANDERVDVIARATVSATGPATMFEAALHALFADDVGGQIQAGRVVARCALAFQSQADIGPDTVDIVARLFDDGTFDSVGVPKAIAAVVAGADEPQRATLEPITAGLRSDRGQTRESAVEVCEEVQKAAPTGLDEEILTTVLERADDPDFSVRVTVAGALPAFSSTDHPEIGPVVRSLVSDDRQLVRTQAISNLSDIERDGDGGSEEAVFDSLLENTKPQDTDAGVVRGLYAERSFRTLSHRALRELLTENPDLLTASALTELVEQTEEAEMESIAIHTVEVAVAKRPELCGAAVVECARRAVRRTDRSMQQSGFALFDTLATHRADLLDGAVVDAVLDRQDGFENLQPVLDILDSVQANTPAVLTERHVRDLVELTGRLREEGVLTPAELWSSAELFAEIARMMPAAIDPTVIDLLAASFEREHSVVRRRTGRALQSIAEQAPTSVLDRRDELVEKAGPAGHQALSTALVAVGTPATPRKQELREQIAAPMCPEPAKSVFVDFLARIPSQQGPPPELTSDREYSSNGHPSGAGSEGDDGSHT
jgi:hypothetical protein